MTFIERVNALLDRNDAMPGRLTYRAPRTCYACGAHLAFSTMSEHFARAHPTFTPETACTHCGLGETFHIGPARYCPENALREAYGR